MLSIKRLTPKQIVALYDDIGYKPCVGTFFQKGKKCCPVSAIYMKNFGVFNSKTNLKKRFKTVSCSLTDYERDFIYNYDCLYTGYKTSEIACNKGVKVRELLMKKFKNL